MIKALRGLLEPDERRVAFCAVAAEASLVGIGVTRAARRVEREERSGLVAAVAIDGVTAGQRESGHGGVIERLRVERTELGIAAGVLDVASYRERRRAALARFATQMADEVKAAAVARVLEPMSAADRKVIHDTLSAVDGIVTRSEGDDPQRRVIIAPAND